jgi:hypothetical protein
MFRGQEYFKKQMFYTDQGCFIHLDVFCHFFLALTSSALIRNFYKVTVGPRSVFIMSIGFPFPVLQYLDLREMLPGMGHPGQQE